MVRIPDPAHVPSPVGLGEADHPQPHAVDAEKAAKATDRTEKPRGRGGRPRKWKSEAERKRAYRERRATDLAEPERLRRDLRNERRRVTKSWPKSAENWTGRTLKPPPSSSATTSFRRPTSSSNRSLSMPERVPNAQRNSSTRSFAKTRATPSTAASPYSDGCGINNCSSKESPMGASISNRVRCCDGRRPARLCWQDFAALPRRHKPGPHLLPLALDRPS